ncbi:MAG: lysophospholipase [Coriobacteriales bacterium]|jgi:pimeloyl-ACP methyl ester carboxylesterase|nr:lysophospholipase [Coriobacteriales bacterium]
MAARTTNRRGRLAKRIAIITAIVLVLLYVVGGFILSNSIYSQNFVRDDVDRAGIFVPNLVYGDINQKDYPRTEFRFPSGDAELVGYEYGAGNTRGLVVVSSGLGGTGDNYMNFVTRFVDDGFLVITYDMTGVAQSGGDSMRGVYQGALDVDALLSHIEREPRYGELPIYLIGHSWGGYGVCAALVHPHRVKAVVSMAGYNSGNEVFTTQGTQMAGPGFYVLYPHLWILQRMVFGSAMDVTATDGINASGIPVLVMQGSNDEEITADVLSIYAYRDEITNSKTEYLLTDGDHEWLYASPAAQEYRAAMQASWEEYSQRPDVQAELASGDTSRIQAAKRAWADEVGFDKPLYNSIDEGIMQRIESFFDNAS